MVRQKKHLKEKNNCFVLVRNDATAQRKREGEGKRAREREICTNFDNVEITLNRNMFEE